MKLKKQFSILSKTHWLFALLAFIFGTAYVYLTPPLWGIDETTHFARVYQIVQNNIFSKKNKKINNIQELPENLVALRNYVKDDLMDNKNLDILSRKDVNDINTYKKNINHQFSPNRVNSNDIAFYSALSYIGPILGVIISSYLKLSIGITISMARIFSLVIYIFLTWISLKILQKSKLKWILFVISLLPISLFQASVVSADGLLLCLSLLFFSLIIQSTIKPSQKSKLNLVAITLIAYLLPIIKFNYFFISILIIFYKSTLFKTKKIATGFRIILLIIIFISCIMWQQRTGVTNTPSISPRPDGLPISPKSQLSYIIKNPSNFIISIFKSIIIKNDGYTLSMISTVGWNWVNVPIIVTSILVLSLLLASIYSSNEIKKYKYFINIAGCTSLLGILSIFGALYILFNPIGSEIIDGVQGRYFIPFLFPILALIGSYVPFEIKMNNKIATIFFGSISTIGLIFSLVFYYLATY